VYKGDATTLVFSKNETLYAPDGFQYASYGWSMAFDPNAMTFMVGSPFQGRFLTISERLTGLFIAVSFVRLYYAGGRW
jgi:predicted acetyltransferase